MRRSDSVAPLRRALEGKPPLPVAHELGARARDESATLLHGAARYGRLKCARLLLDSAGEHPLLELKDAGGFTPLLMAAWCGHLEMVRLLLSRGASTEPEGVPPMTSVVARDAPLRDDAVTDGAQAEAVVKNAPEPAHGFFTVPKVVE